MMLGTFSGWGVRHAPMDRTGRAAADRIVLDRRTRREGPKGRCGLRDRRLRGTGRVQDARRRLLEAGHERAVAVPAPSSQGQGRELPVPVHGRYQRRDHRDAVHRRLGGSPDRFRHRLPDRRRVYRRHDHAGERRGGQRDPCRRRKGDLLHRRRRCRELPSGLPCVPDLQRQLRRLPVREADRRVPQRVLAQHQQRSGPADVHPRSDREPPRPVRCERVRRGRDGRGRSSETRSSCSTPPSRTWRTAKA